MQLGSIPMQTITDLAALVELVKELKAGGAANLMIELKDAAVEHQHAETAQTERLSLIETNFVILEDRERKVDSRESAVLRDRETLKTQRDAVKTTLASARQAEETALQKLDEVNRSSTRLRKNLEDREGRIKAEEAEVSQLQAEALALKTEYEERIARFKEVADSV